MSSWTARYLDVALRGTPDGRRSDLERELRSSITDALDERIGAGQDDAAAERSVLEALGDPARLAAEYSGRPNYLIGPELFPLYRAILPRGLAVAMLGGALVLAGLQLFSGGNWVEALIAVPGGVINIAVQVAFWGTVAFVVLEHVTAAGPIRVAMLARVRPWKVEDLPEPSAPRVAAREVVTEIGGVVIVLAGMLYLWGLAVPGLNGANGLFDGPFLTGWFQIGLVALVARGALHVLVLAVGRWTLALAGLNAMLSLVFALPIVIFALAGQLVDSYYADGISWHDLPDGAGLPMLAVVAGVTLLTAWEIGRVFARAGGAGPLRSIVPASRASV
jgi:hypothetical protein